VAAVTGEAIIRVEGLNFAYPGGQPALKNVCLSVADGETVALIGPNGAGKTTLFLCLAGVLRVRKGTVSLAGLDPAEPAHRSQLPAKVGVVFQNSDDQLFNATVFDDVAFGPLNLGLPPDEVRVRVAESLDRVGMTGMDERVPYRLSGGEKRRAALAGVLAMRPEILLLDEPTMFLDPRGRRELMAFLNDLPGTKVIATHDLEFVLKSCCRAIVLDGGTIAANGPALEVMSNAELMDQHGLEVPWSLRR
jgi:cobalt/nickel transport system ATP-binding protein